MSNEIPTVENLLSASLHSALFALFQSLENREADNAKKYVEIVATILVIYSNQPSKKE